LAIEQFSAIKTAKGPLLFSLYINDLPTYLNSVPTEQLGVPVEPHDNACKLSNILFADDLTLLDSSNIKLQHLLDRLLAYTRIKGMTVNVAKSAVMVFNPGRAHHQPVSYHNTPLPFVDEFKFLGLWLNNRFSSHYMVSKLIPSVWAAWRRAVLAAKQKALLNVPAACLLLVHTFVMPSALFGCQVWGPDLINMASHLTSLSSASSYPVTNVSYIFLLPLLQLLSWMSWRSNLCSGIG
jgi:hypothetical protein